MIGRTLDELDVVRRDRVYLELDKAVVSLRTTSPPWVWRRDGTTAPAMT
jgi:hypothetical protein